MRHIISLPGALLAACALGLVAAFAAHAQQDVALVGVIGNKAAVVAVDGGDPKTIRVGQAWRGILVLSVERDQATLEIDGQRRVLQRGAHYRSAQSAAPAGRQSATLAADSRGHFFAEGAINGGHVRFVVDTGATTIALPAPDAVRLGIDYRKGRVVRMTTANGVAPAYMVMLDRVKIGDIELYGVESVVVEGGLNVALLGMTFLNRVEMRREGQTMTLIRMF